ncbi:LysR family transcriptional regulator [Pasteurella atlantica]|uniref:LysR family transcriptional regulator n=1 Tax=Pasteurellaceae TaxID=712 RepID=UPI00274A8BA2|nr:LysR family transcriptional regulator [Pasteurella atlantica]MDP8033955.1 LysR family transcriptional regulator [Pasteurella atlantica]MDP8035828.1 LysR family transcriptional regulator [Pasteurella atlantica]MDP8037839.1 LysR family transcriptional regulator [Pasteurella atlantica]MDP8048185.1 LysR family transcriptional regulator [Pasteurella atlantica]MDP8050145.1 LysR family transcriptional regulator [Pasteurella atlantica]
MLNDFYLFVLITEAGSFQQAAKQENIPAATLTRRLQKLEDKLGCKLLHRSPRGITLTAEGEIYLDKCQPLIEKLQQNIQDIQQNNNQTKGTVRVLAPINLSVVLADFWSDFLIQYPDINLILSLNNRNDNFLEQSADIALRVGKQKDSNLIQKHLATMPMCIVASEKYLQNNPRIQCPNDLLNHQWIASQPLSPIIDLAHKHNNEKTQISLHNIVHNTNTRLQVNEIRLCVSLAKRGLGLTYVPEILCKKELQRGELVRILTEWQPPSRDIYAVWHTQKYLPIRVRVLIDALMDYFNHF